MAKRTSWMTQLNARLEGGGWLTLAVLAVISLSILGLTARWACPARPIPVVLAQSITDTIHLATATPASTATEPPPSATPTPIGGEAWIGEVVSQTDGPFAAWALLRVKVDGLTGLPVDILTSVEFIGQGVTGSKPDDLADDEVEFAGLSPGQYIIAPKGLNTQLTLDLQKNTTVNVWFYKLPTPTPAPTVTPTRPTSTPRPTATSTATPPVFIFWRGSLAKSSVRPMLTGNRESEITVQSPAYPADGVVLLNDAGQQQRCRPVDGNVCRFSRLAAGVYTIDVASRTARYSVFVDGLGQVTVAFTEETSPEPRPTPAPIIGRGAAPNRGRWGIGSVPATPTATHTPTVTPTPSATATPRPTSPPTATPTITPRPSPTPAMAWQGAIAERYQHPGQTIVVRAPMPGHPVTLKSGPWHIQGLTGDKPEYGDFAVEFGGLAAGNYTAVLEGLGEMSISLGTGEFVLVQFSYGLAPTPTPTAVPGQWTAALIEDTNGAATGGGAWSIITVDVAGRNNVPVIISTDGFQTECVTGSKPELGPGVCQVGGLWPGTYRIQPQGVPLSFEVTMDGQGAVRVAFWQQ